MGGLLVKVRVCTTSLYITKIHIAAQVQKYKKNKIKGKGALQISTIKLQSVWYVRRTLPEETDRTWCSHDRLTWLDMNSA
jgi:hypothetical protein